MDERHYERKFYHDLLNLASSMRGISEVFKDVDEQTRAEMLPLLGHLSETMIETINLRRQYCGLLAQDLKLMITSVDCEKLLMRLKDIYSRHTLSDTKKILIAQSPSEQPTSAITLKTDKDLLQGTLGYGIRAALEATPSGGTVTLSLSTDSQQGRELASFHIVVTCSIPEEQKPFIFKKPQGDGHGLTGHSAFIFYTLITEILKGSASWTSKGSSVTLTAQFERPV
jgi:signal transduction histidine kinase